MRNPYFTWLGILAGAMLLGAAAMWLVGSNLERNSYTDFGGVAQYAAASWLAGGGFLAAVAWLAAGAVLWRSTD